MLTKALDSLKFDICSKIELAVGGVQADIAAVREELTSSVTSLQKTVDGQEGRLKELEASATVTSDSVSAIEVTVSELQSQVKELQTKCEDLENRSRRNNIRLVVVLEDKEGAMVTEFVSNLLQGVLGLDEKPLIDRLTVLCKLNRSPINLRDPLSSEYTTFMSANSFSVRHVNYNLSQSTDDPYIFFQI